MQSKRQGELRKYQLDDAAAVRAARSPRHGKTPLAREKCSREHDWANWRKLHEKRGDQQIKTARLSLMSFHWTGCIFFDFYKVNYKNTKKYYKFLGMYGLHWLL